MSYPVYTIEQTSSKRPAISTCILNVHVLIARRLLDRVNRVLDIALKPAMTMTNCMINVDWAWHVASKQPELESRRLCCLEGSFIDRLSTLTIHDNSGALSGANCRSVWLIAPLVSGVASSKADTLNIWCENCEMLLLLWIIIEAINRLFCYSFFRMCCYRHRLVFNSDTFEVWWNDEIFSDSVTTNFLLIPTVKKF